MAQAAVRLAPRTPSPEIVAGTLQLGPYLYRISSDQLASRLAVSSGKQSITASIAWIFGAGVHGQTYILEHDGALYESQVSSFAALRGMDITPGHTAVDKGNLQNALGERLSTSAAARCFAWPHHLFNDQFQVRRFACRAGNPLRAMSWAGLSAHPRDSRRSARGGTAGHTQSRASEPRGIRGLLWRLPPNHDGRG